MEPNDLAAQREGYAKALVSEEFLRALRAGPVGKIALTYFEWSSTSDQKIVVPWRQIDGPEAAEAVATEIMKAPIRRGSRTSISSAIKFAVPLFEQNPYRGSRRVIDISGDGPNNDGRHVPAARSRRRKCRRTGRGAPPRSSPNSPARGSRSRYVRRRCS